MADKTQFNLYVDRALAREVRHAAVAADKRLSDYVAEVLAAHLERERRIADQVGELLAGRLKKDQPAS